MMTSPVLFLTTYFFLGDIVSVQTTAPFSVQRETKKIGENLTLECLSNTEGSPKLYWFKQTLEQELKLISVFRKHGTVEYFTDDSKNNPRFSLRNENGQNHLTISDVHVSDSATYYCISTALNTLQIMQTVVVDVMDPDLNIPVWVQQSGSETFQPGGNVTLNCTVKTRTCDGEHNVYWFKDAAESQPRLIYTNGGRTNQCEKKLHNQTNKKQQTCVYNLPMTKLDRSHTGTYYCSVVSCGRILFGNGTKLDFEERMDFSLLLVYLLSGSLTIMTVLVVVLSYFMFKMKNQNTLQSQEASSARNNEEHGNAENLFYAALSINRPNTSRRQRDIMTKDECVYSSVRQ